MPAIPAIIPYLLVVRWPVGGIRTHLKYARQLLKGERVEFAPHVVAMDDADTRLLLDNLKVPAEADHTRGVHNIVGMALRVLKVCLTSPKISVVHSQGFISAMLAYPAVLLTGKRHIVTVHDVVTDQVLTSKSALGLRLLGFVLKHAYAVHAVGRDCAQSLRRLPALADASNIVTIANGINPAQFSGVQPADLRSQLNLSPQTRLIGFFGRFMGQKGFTDLIAAVSQIRASDPHTPFRVLAVGEGDYLREYREFVQEANLTDTILFLPRAENPAALMAGCDMVAMPSLWEAYPLQAPEVLCLGVPLIASDCIGLREVTAGTPARTFAAQNPQALAAALRAELQSPSTTQAKAYTALARERFDFAPNALKLNQLLDLVRQGKPLP
jgi:glycosyltransferase involved in cell wall biosynthesis